MRASIRLSFVILLALAGCTGALAPPEGALNGTWTTPLVPSGGGKWLDLRSSGTSVSGTGTDYGLMHVVTGTYTIAGSYRGASIDLTMSYDGGSTATFSGHLVGANTLQGTWTGPDGGDFTFARAS